MFLTKRKILKAIKEGVELIGVRHNLIMMQQYGLLSKHEEKLLKWVKGLVYDSEQNAILNYHDLSIVKRF